MGNILRRHRNPVDELDQIVKNLQSYQTRLQSLRRGRYNAMWYFTAFLFFFVTVYSAVSCLEADDSKSMYQRIALAWFTGILVFITFRFISGRCFDFLLNRNERNIETLNTRRTAILEDVKENEKFKVAKDIIEKYGSEQDLAEIGVKKESPPKLSESRFIPPENINIKQPFPANPTESENLQEFGPLTPEVAQAGSSTDVVLRTPSIPMNRAIGLRTPMQRQPIRPFVQVSRTPIDKIIDYIIGDGPSNRFALICKQCHAHNGMALREEFDGISFVCYNCAFYNPARNAQPLRTPRRLNIPAIEESKPFIRTATNTDSSDSDDAESNVGRPWVAETESPEIVEKPIQS